MYTTSPEGLANIYATEPKVYVAAFPSVEQQQRYALQGAIAVLFVSSLVAIALAVS